MLYRAFENIDSHYVFYGFFSSLKESIDILLRKMDWKEVPISVSNVTPKKPSIDEIPDKTLNLIIKYNQLDIKLYNVLLEKYNLKNNHLAYCQS